MVSTPFAELRPCGDRLVAHHCYCSTSFATLTLNFAGAVPLAPKRGKIESSPVLTSSLVDFAHDELHRLITDGDLAEGERIVIDQFARQFGTSLIPVREALARLHAEGLATFERNKGYRVAPRQTLAELRRLFEARLVIEMGAAELALKRCDRAAVNRLRAINRLIAKTPYGTTFEGFREFVSLNESFHVELMALSDNPPLSEAYSRLGYHQKITRPTFGHGPGDIKRLVREHETIIAALEKRDLAALRRAVREHISTGLERVSGDSAEAKDRSRTKKNTSLLLEASPSVHPNRPRTGQGRTSGSNRQDKARAVS